MDELMDANFSAPPPRAPPTDKLSPPAQPEALVLAGYLSACQHHPIPSVFSPALLTSPSTFLPISTAEFLLHLRPATRPNRLRVASVLSSSAPYRQIATPIVPHRHAGPPWIRLSPFAWPFLPRRPCQTMPPTTQKSSFSSRSSTAS